MDIFGHLLIGFETAFTWVNVLYCFVGVFLGTLVGVLPGIGVTATVAMLLPITFSLEPTTGLIMLAGIYYGSQYGGSTTAILVNLPGEASAAVTAIDGYQMARQGRAGAALTIAALGSFFGGTVATLVVAVLAPPLTYVALRFGPPEYCALILLGLVMSVTLAHGSVLKAMAMIVLGLLLGLVGTDIYTAVPRFTLGFPELSDGISIVSIAIGIFGTAEILRNLEVETGRETVTKKVSGLWPRREDLKQAAGPILRGTVLGSFLGILPGAGAVLASFASYATEKKLSKHPERFGKGAIEGVAGPETANNAAAQTSFIPMLTLGIPSSAIMAMMLGAMVVQGIVPGPGVMTEKPELFWGFIVSMWLGNVFLVILNLPLIGIWVKLLTVPYSLLFPAILAFSAIGAFTVNSNPFDLYAIAAFGALGYLLLKVGCEPAPLLIGFVLGPMFEEQLRRSMLLSRGDPSIFVYRPISAVLLVIVAVMLVMMISPVIKRKRKQIFVEES